MLFADVTLPIFKKLADNKEAYKITQHARSYLLF